MSELYCVWIILDQTYDNFISAACIEKNTFHVWFLFLVSLMLVVFYVIASMCHWCSAFNCIKGNNTCTARKFGTLSVGLEIFAKRRMTLIIAKIGRNMFIQNVPPYLFHFIRSDFQRKILPNLLTYHSLLVEIRNVCLCGTHRAQAQ